MDFNVAADLTESDIISGATGVKHWSAPETRANYEYDAKCDVYSLGCLLLFMLTGAQPESEKAQLKIADLDKNT